MTLGQVIALMRQQWPFPTGRNAVLSGYRALGVQHRHLLADIALRNNVYGSSESRGDLFEAGKAEGRRVAALEIIQLAKLDPDLLFDLVEKRTTSNRGERT